MPAPTFGDGLDHRLAELQRLDQLEDETQAKSREAQRAKADAEAELAAYIVKQLGQLPPAVLRRVAQAFRERDTGTIDRF